MIGNQSEEDVQAIKERATIVQTFAPQGEIKSYQECIKRVQEVIQDMSLIQDDIRQCFVEDLLIAGTRDWEAFEFVGGKKRFQVEPPKTLHMNTKLIKSVYDFPDLNLKTYEYENEIEQAKQLLLDHLDIMSMLAGENIMADDEEKFFQATKFYQYTFHIVTQKKLLIIYSFFYPSLYNQLGQIKLFGVSSTNGYRVCVNVYKRLSLDRLKTLIHELAHNFYIALNKIINFSHRFRTQVKKILCISPEFNKNLRQNDKLIEAGDWMETKIFSDPKENPDPFSLKID